MLRDLEFVNCNLQTVGFELEVRNICNYEYFLCNYKLFGFVKLASGRDIRLSILRTLKINIWLAQSPAVFEWVNVLLHRSIA